MKLKSLWPDINPIFGKLNIPFGNPGRIHSRSGSKETLLFHNFGEDPPGWLRSAGFVEQQQGIPADQPRRFGRFGAMYLVSGGGRYRDEFGTDRAVRAGDLILAFPDLLHSYGPAEPGQPWDEFYVDFDGPMFRLWESAGVLDHRHPVLRLEPIDYWLRRFMDVVQSYLSPQHIPSVRDVVRLQDVLAEALESGGRGARTRANSAWLDAALAAVATSATSPAPPDWGAMAQRLGTGYENFRKKFTRLTGMSPGRYRMRCLMRRACDLIRDPELRIKEAADRCGFAHPYHFSRQFKQVVGVSPSEFRNRSGSATG